jgi:hypothetical protein
MSGVLVNILPKRTFDFSNVASGSSQKYTIAERIDISQYVDATLILRIHSAVASGGTIAFEVYGDGFTAEDPSLKFATPVALAAVGTTISSTVVAPALQTAGNSTGVNLSGRFALFRVTASRTSASNLNATVSADLLLKSPDDTMSMAGR